MLSLDRQNRYRERYRAMHPGWRTSGEVYESLVRNHICAGAAVLDLGCGAGGVMELFSAQAALPVGIDPHLPSLRGNRDTAICRAQALADDLPFCNAAFDLIVCSWVLEHVIKPRRVFGEISRVLKPGGHFVFLTPNAANYITRLNRLAPRLAQARLVRALYGRAEDDTFEVAYRANTLGQLHGLATSAGLNIVALTTVHDPTYLAFNDLAFRLSAAFESGISDSSAVHIIGDLVKH
jgi:ubiquinone/menaquinone biosynthesis C-methylase UbiE